MNKIDYSNWTFTDADIVSGNVAMSNALMFDSLNPDELTVEVISDVLGVRKVLVQTDPVSFDTLWYNTVDHRGYVVSDGDIRNFTYGTPLTYYYDNVLQGRYYVRSVERLSVDHFRINAFSMVGMWASIQHLGGLYGQNPNNPDTVGTVLEEIINGGANEVKITSTSTTDNGVTFTRVTDDTWIVNGTAGTGGASCNLWGGDAMPHYNPPSGFQYWLTIENKDAPVGAYISYPVYDSGGRMLELESFTTYSSQAFYLGGAITLLELYVPEGSTVNNVTVKVLITKNQPRHFQYSIDSAVANINLYGWLPVASVRDNVQQVLFAVGASLMKGGDGYPRFEFLQNNTAINIPNNRIFIGGQLSYKTPATSVQVVEHNFYKSDLDVRESLFDNTDGQSGTAVSQIVTFDKPYYDFEWQTSPNETPVAAVGAANYAYVNGNGILTGKPYTHATRTFMVDTGVVGEPKESKVEKATLVSPVNSPNVAARVADYQATAEEVSCGVVMSTDNIKCGSLVSFNDPYGEATQGIVSQMNITMSGKSKADCTIVKGYTPSHFGNTFSNVAVITVDTPKTAGEIRWAIPTGTQRIRIVLGSGGEAGQNGYNGTAATTTSNPLSAIAGEGGAYGVGGKGGNVYSTDIVNPTGYISFTIGRGGTTGTGEGAVGKTPAQESSSRPRHTVAICNGTRYSSENGSIPPEGFRDIINGVTYSTSGINGVSGGDGGFAEGGSHMGGNVTFGSTTWNGGNIGASRITDYSDGQYLAYGGSGGGAAYGSNGGNGGDWYIHPNVGRPRGGDGGRGADAEQTQYNPVLGGGGAGGNGGGGGGCDGYYHNVRTQHDVDEEGFGGSVGVGGEYSGGTFGGDGYALIYY